MPEVADATVLLNKYNALRSIRLEVTKQLEEVRAAGQIGASLQADLTLQVTAPKYTLLTSLGEDLKFIFITSSARVTLAGTGEQETVQVTASAEKKCERCWHYRADVGSQAEHAGLCQRCVQNLFGAGEVRRFA